MLPTRKSPRPHLDDPYLKKLRYTEPTVCPKCGIVYIDKRWQYRPRFSPPADTKYRKCPACRKIEDHYAMGLVFLSGDFIPEHEEEITHLIQNQGRQSFRRNPLDRLMSMVKVKDGYRIETTTEHLALTLGRALYHAYGGELEYRFSEDQKVVRVYWHRDQAKERR
ncbi:ATPase [candidate division WOR-3 bacterium]|uniref:ATPase n=1 Tax=candidate division WOR-3 bacterium TaxID=2052148 RepID=A0A660SEH0_UNCW3|nr:MAG: ATPase [candidate division WOR-3 bacterium]